LNVGFRLRQRLGVLVDQYRHRQIARGRTRCQYLLERAAILIVEWSGMGNIIGHAQNVAANKLRVFVGIGPRDAQRVLDHLAGRT